MKTTWTLKENSTGELVVDVNKDAWKKAQNKALENLSKDLEVQGFRKGHAPKDMARKHIGEQKLFMEAMNLVANEAFVAGIVEQKIEPVSQPQLDVKKMTADELELSFEVVVKPEVELGEYKGVKVEAEDTTVTEEEVTAELEKIQEQNAQLVVVEDAEVENGHTVVIDFEGFKDDVAFEGGKGENHTLEIGSNSFIPGFEEALVGMKTGESRDINLTFPDTYHVEELKNADVVFKVELHEIKKREIPELNDELVELLDDENVETLDALKASVREKLETEKKSAEEDRLNDQLVQTVSENAKVEIPTAMIEEELNQMFNEFNQRLSQQGMNFELYTQILGQTEEDVREQMREDAGKRVRSRLVLEKIAEVEELKVEENEVEEEYSKIAEMYNMEVAQVKELVAPDAIQYDILLRKAVELVQTTQA